MIPLDHVLALAVLLAPMTGAEPEHPGEYVAIWRTIRDVALTIELLDPRESAYVMSSASDYQTDLRLLRRRQSDLAGAPPADDARRLPSRQLACQQLRLNREFHRALCVRHGALGRTPLGDETMAETDRLYKVWDAVRDAGSEFYYVSVRRLALAQLRRMIGEPAYQSGELPPPTPGSLAD